MSNFWSMYPVLVAKHLPARASAQQCIDVSVYMQPVIEQCITVEGDRPRLFRLNDFQRHAIRGALNSATWRNHCVYETYGRLNGAAIELGIDIENVVSEQWRLEAGGKPRD